MRRGEMMGRRGGRREKEEMEITPLSATEALTDPR
jgi:hypothetical protein